MTTIKNRGGRPKGSGHNFHQELREVADLLRRNPKMTRRAAMIRVLAKRSRPAGDNGLRSLQRHWKAQGAEVIAEVKESAKDKRRSYTSAPMSTPRTTEDLFRMAQSARSALDQLDLPALHGAAATAAAALETLHLRAFLDQESPLMRTVREMNERQDALRNMVDPMWRFR